MASEIKIRKPKAIKFFGFAKQYNAYTNRLYKWMYSLPENGTKIKITWFPSNNGEKNAYIGWEGIVENLNRIEGTFSINSGTAILICKGDFNYIKL